jgi:Holliday junction resolvase RusA-like endonuclease
VIILAKRRFKNKKTKISEYNTKYHDIPKDDPVARVMHCIGDKLTERRVKEIIRRKNKILAERTYSCINLTLYEEPSGSERPRHRSIGDMITTYVPNAKDNKNYILNFVKKLNKDIQTVHTPIFIKIDIYHPMPSSASIEEQVLFEAKIIPPATKPDIDNVYKAYTDNLIEILFLDDDLIYKANLEKFYSFLPRIEMKIYYADQFTSKYIYDKIRNRKSFKRISSKIELSKLIM